MGLHAFDAEPSHCAAYRRLIGDALPPLRGFAERWNMPAARHEAVLADDAAFAGVDHYVLTLQLNAVPVRRVDDPRFAATATTDAISLQRPGSGGSFRSDGVVRYAHFYFKQSFLCELGDSLGLGTGAELDDVFAINAPALARDLAAYVRRSDMVGEPPIGIEMDSRSYLIGIELLRHLNRGETGALRSVNTLSPAHLRRVVALIEERLDTPLRLSELAAAVALSPFHFARTFRQTTGETPAAYLMRRRTERAAELIERTDLSLAEVAYRSGFSSQSHMTRVFKKRFGTTPGAVRGGRR